MFKKVFRSKHAPPHKRRSKVSKPETYLIVLMSLALMSSMAFGQGTNATLSGTVQDATGGVIVGANIIAHNNDTGVETRATTNNAGIYNMVLQPGNNYEVYADAPGFQRTSRTGVRLGAGAQVNLPLPMAIAGQVTEIEVTGTAEGLVLEASASTGAVIQEEIIAAIPTVAPNAIEATLSVMGGVVNVSSGSKVFSAASQEVAGISSSMINVSRDGITVNEVRSNTGIAASSNINPEVVGEMRVIQSAVDAELGRGAGQIQITTRSGSNAYRGSAVWNVQNTALDATDFSVKQRGLTKNWRNINNYTVSVSGPIIRNRTFFFANWEQQIARDKMIQIPRVMTSCARRGIYRWLSTANNPLTGSNTPTGYLPSVISATDSYAMGQGLLRSVNADGTPWGGNAKVYNSNAEFAEVQIGPTTVEFESVFGQLRPDVRAALADRNNPLGAYGNGVDGCTMLDTLGYNPMNNQFLTTGSGATNQWAPNAYRHAYDPTGFAHRFALTGANYADGKDTIMPPANYYMGQGDGLNSAGHKWTTLMIGQGSSNYGTGGDPDRKSFTTRIDHNINNDHRISGSMDWETFYVWDAYRVWPAEYGGYHGDITRKPIRFSITLNSTLAPTVLNEFRFGLSKANTWIYKPLDSITNKDNMSAVLKSLAGNDGSNPYYAGSWAQDQNLIIGLGEGDGERPGTLAAGNATAYRPDMNPVMGATDNIDRSHPYGTRGNIQQTGGGSDPRWSFGDTVTWIKGSHSFRGGVEYRRQASGYTSQGGGGGFARGGGYAVEPILRGGLTDAAIDRRRQSLSSARADGLGWQNIYAGSQDTATTTSGNYVHAYNLMTYFSGSLNDTSRWYYAIPDPSSPTGARWNDATAGEYEFVTNIRNQEFSWFFKDDWKVTSELTLNLGVRWEYYGVPHADGGKTLRMRGDSQNAWGITKGGDFYNNGKGWVVDRQYLDGFERDAAGNPILPDPVISFEYVGPGSPNSDRMVWNRDLNNFAPHVGFAWQLPWFGKGLTTLRGGYSISYTPLENLGTYSGQIASVGAAAVTYARTFSGDGDNTDPNSFNYYMDLTDVRNLVPLKPADNVRPLGIQLNDALYGSAATAIYENITNPYIHSLNASLTRSIGRMFTLDLRYVGTFRRNPVGNLNVNANTYLDTTLLNWITELDTVRAGGESMFINSLIPHNDQTRGQLYYSPTWNETGSDQLRRQAAGNLARGVYSTVVSSLGSANGWLPTPMGSESGLLMRSGCLPKDRPGYAAAFAANPRANVHDYPCMVGTPLNMFYSAPQYATSNFRHNVDQLNNYNSLQVQMTMRPTNGLNFQATYTWSRNLGNGTWSNYLGERDYVLSSQHRSHTFRSFGSYELPFGPRGFLFRSASGAAKKAIENWNLSWILSMESGAPLSVTTSGAGSTLWGRSWPILVRSDLWDDKQGKATMEWNSDGTFKPGTYLARNYVKVLDANLCNPERMTAGLYTGQCVNAAGVVNSSAPHALALADANGKPVLYDRDTLGDDGVRYMAGTPVIVFRNADQSDGRNASGNYKPNRMAAQGIFTFDVAMSKSVEFMEGKRFEIRVDVQNLLNHATPISNYAPTAMESGGKYVSVDPPSMGLTGSGAIGQMLNKGGHRTFQARLALRF